MVLHCSGIKATLDTASLYQYNHCSQNDDWIIYIKMIGHTDVN